MNRRLFLQTALSSTAAAAVEPPWERKAYSFLWSRPEPTLSLDVAWYHMEPEMVAAMNDVMRTSIQIGWSAIVMLGQQRITP